MQEKSSIKQNILEFLDFKGVSQYLFYKKTGITRGILSQDNGLSEDNLMRFLDYYTDVNTEWLLTRKGPMLKKDLSHQEDVALELNEPGEDYGYAKKIPLVSNTAIAGFGNSNFSIAERDVKDYYVIPKFKHKKIDFMIEVEGSSMYPKYNSGDVVGCTIIKESSFIQWNKVHVIATKEQGIIIKRIKKSDKLDTYTMVSDNKSYDPFDVPESEIDGIALVVGVIRLE